jgi:hypothetical protein
MFGFNHRIGINEMRGGAVSNFIMYYLEDFLKIFETKEIHFLPGPILAFFAPSHQYRINKNCLLRPEAQF